MQEDEDYLKLAHVELIDAIFKLRVALIELDIAALKGGYPALGVVDDPQWKETFNRLDRYVNEAVRRGLMVRTDKKED